MTKARAFLKELKTLDELNGIAEYHRNVEITQETRSAYARGHEREIENLRKKYGVTERLVDVRPNGIAKYELTCDDGSVVGTVHGTVEAEK